MSRRFVIMANGQGTRWGGHLGIPKQLIDVEGETLLQRITRQVHEFCDDAEVIISSANPEMEAVGASRYEPQTNQIELDRFVPELIQDGVTFLYGDTMYVDSAVQRIVVPVENGLQFFGDERSIVAVQCAQARVMLEHLDVVRAAYLNGEIDNCIGWQVYQSYTDQPFGPVHLGEHFVDLTGMMAGFNSPGDHRRWHETLTHGNTPHESEDAAVTELKRTETRMPVDFGFESRQLVYAPDGSGSMLLERSNGVLHDVVVTPPVMADHDVVRIGPRALAGTGMSRFHVSAPVETIDVAAVEGCAQLRGVVLPASVRHIGERAFADNPNLRHVVLPEGIETIGARAFAGCTNLQHVTLPRSAQQIAEDAFEDCPAIVELRETSDTAAAGDLVTISPELRQPLSEATIHLSLRMVCDLLDVEVPSELLPSADVLFPRMVGGLLTTVPGCLYFGKHAAPSGPAVEELLERKVAAFVSDRPLFDQDGKALPCLIVEDPMDAFITVTAAISRTIAAKKIALTGSVGKTTTKEMVQRVCATEYATLYSKGNHNGPAQVGRYVQMVEETHQVYIQETGAGRPGLVDKSARILLPDAFILTNIGLNHVGAYGGSQDALLADKASLDKHLPDDGVAFINYDDEKLRALRLTHRVVSFGMNSRDVDYYAQDVLEKDGILSFTVVERATGETLDIGLHSFGVHNVYNALVAVAVGRWLDVPTESIREGLEQYRGEGLRQNLMTVGGRRILVDAYNASEVALSSAADALATIRPGGSGRRVYVVADIDDKLGDITEEVHRRVGQALGARQDLDEIVFFGQHMAWAAEEARQLASAVGATIVSMTDRHALHQHLEQSLSTDDVVGFKGGQQMALSITIDHLFGTALVLEDGDVLQKRGKKLVRDDVRYRIVREAGALVAGLGQGFTGEHVVIAPKVRGVGVVMVGKLAFSGTSLTSVAVPEPVRTIAKSAFFRARELKWVLLPQSLRVVERSAFNGCSKLIELNVPDGVTTLGDRVFYGCRRLQRVSIPASVVQIGESVFQGCRSVEVTCVKDSYAHRFMTEHWPNVPLNVLVD